MAQPAASAVPAHSVAVFATAATVASRVFPAEIAKRAPQIRVLQQACPDLVPLIEAGAPDAQIQPRVFDYVTALRQQLDGGWPDIALLGCTHYPLVAPLFAAALGPAVRVIVQADLVADSLADYLTRHPRFAGDGAVQGPVLCTSGSPAEVNRQGNGFLNAGWLFGHLTERAGLVSG
jgi:glutamate racemase